MILYEYQLCACSNDLKNRQKIYLAQVSLMNQNRNM